MTFNGKKGKLNKIYFYILEYKNGEEARVKLLYEVYDSRADTLRYKSKNR